MYRIGKIDSLIPKLIVALSVVGVLLHHLIIRNSYDCVENTGGFLGTMGAAGPLWIGCSLVVVAFLAQYIYSAIKRKEINSYIYPLGTLLIGGLGNLLDRIGYGYVCDYFEVSIGSISSPFFNINDMIIVGSLVWIVILSLKLAKDNGKRN